MVPSRALFAKKVAGWTVVSIGICVGLLSLAILDRKWGYPQTASYLFELLAAAFFGFALPFASIVAIRNPRRAGYLFLLFSPFAFSLFFLTEIDRLHLGMLLWYDWLGYSLSAGLVFVLPGVFWLATHRFKWPLLLPKSEIPMRRRLLEFAGASLLLLILVLAAAVALAILTPPFAIDCDKRVPISRLGPAQVVFVGKVVRTLGPCVEYGRRLCGGAVAIVEEKFWGVRSNIVLLTQGYFEDGEQYLLDGVHLPGPLTRFLPIIGFRPCSNSVPLANAQVNLRLLRDRSLQGTAVRIIGTVTKHEGHKRQAAPGTTVIVAGPEGVLTLTTDAEGIYDVNGLPPGRYEIHVEACGAMPVGHTQCRSTGYELKSGDVGGVRWMWTS